MRLDSEPWPEDMVIDKDLLDRLLAGQDAKELFGSGGLLDELKKALSERILSAELDDHLAREEAPDRGNRRNGTRKKTVKAALAVPKGSRFLTTSAAMNSTASGTAP